MPGEAHLLICASNDGDCARVSMVRHGALTTVELPTPVVDAVLDNIEALALLHGEARPSES